MEIQIANEIQELLFAHGRVALPSIGTFMSEYQAASIDHSAAEITPPQYRLHFDTALPIDDGLLLEHLCNKYAISRTEARKHIEDFMMNMRISLTEGERVNVPEIGRFYSDFSHKIQFLPENTPFNPDTYGMPSVRLQPISRMQPNISNSNNHEITSSKTDITPTHANNNNISTPIAALNDKINSFSDLLTPSLFVLIILVIITMYLYFSDMNNVSNSQYQPVPIENTLPTSPKINAPPPRSQQPAYESQAPQRQPINSDLAQSEYHEFAVKSPNGKITTPNNSKKTTDIIETENIEYNPNARIMRECSVIVGTFTHYKATKRAIDIIENFGYQTFTNYYQDKNIVGCRFSYESVQELQRRLNTLRAKFGENIAIVKK